MNSLDVAPDPRLGILLGAASDAEAREFEEIAAQSLAMLALPHPPPAGLRDRVMELIDAAEAEPQPAHVPAAHLARRRRVRRPAFRVRPVVAILTVAAALLLFIGGFGVSSLVHPGPVPAAESATIPLARVLSASDARRTSIDFASGRASVDIFSSGRVAKSVAILRNAPVPPDGKVYQLWYMRDGHAVSAGTVKLAPGAVTTVTLSGVFRSTDDIAATIEPAGGSAQPTTLPVFELHA